jgi:hypothetical protein
MGGHSPQFAELRLDENTVDPTGFETFVPIKAAPNSSTLTMTPELASHKLLCVVTAQTAGGVVELQAKPV